MQARAMLLHIRLQAYKSKPSVICEGITEVLCIKCTGYQQGEVIQKKAITLLAGVSMYPEALDTCH